MDTIHELAVEIIVTGIYGAVFCVIPFGAGITLLANNFFKLGFMWCGISAFAFLAGTAIITTTIN